MPEIRNRMQMRPGGGPPPRPPFGGRGQEKVKLKDPKRTLRRMLAYMGSGKSKLVFTFILCAITGLVSIGATRLNGYAVDHYIAVKDSHGLMVICAILGGIYLIGVLSTFVQNRFMVRISQETSSSIRQDLYTNMQMLPVKYFDTHSSGDLMSRLTNDVDNINMTLSQNLTQLFGGVINIVGMTLAMLILSPLLFLVGLVTIPLMYVSTRFVVNHAQPYFVSQQRELGKLNGYIEEHISGQKVVLLFGKEDKVKKEFQEINQRLKKNSVLAQALSGVLGPLNNTTNNLTYFIIAVTGAYMILSGWNMSVGVLFTFILYMRNFIRPINQLLSTFNTIQSALAGAERVFEVIDEPKEMSKDALEEVVTPKDQVSIEGHVVLDHVDFAYEEGKEVLKNINLEAMKGKVVAIVGPTGSGKTTIMNLLTRFYDVDRGNIDIDDQSIMSYDKKDIRRQVSMVLQDTFLFSESVRENIRYGRLNASDQEVREAAQIADAHSFIMQLPQGYDTILEDNGGNLSHGQRQLLAIARAVLAQSSILILDEATSSIDTQTELKIQKAMINLMEGKTTFIIAHRLSTIKNADEILVLKEGEIIERGNHDRLMAQDGFYAKLCKTQYKGIAI